MANSIFAAPFKMRLLNLCSGTGSVSVPFRENGWDVVEVDWDDRFDPKHVVDITKWDYTVYDHFDVILVSWLSR